MARGYLLPEGCKDLIDALKLPKQPSPQCSFHIFDTSNFKHVAAYFLKSKQKLLKFKPVQPLPKQSTPLPPVIGEIIVADETMVSHLAKILGQKAFQVIADVMQLGFFVTVKDSISFEIVSSVARKHGFIAKRAV